MVLHGIMSSDDEEVDAWYLEGYCYFLMSENAQKEGGSFEEMTWEELAKEARDRLETCQKAGFTFPYASRSTDNHPLTVACHARAS